MDYKTTATSRIVVDGIPVFCGYDKIVPIDHLCPNPRNPNRHPAAHRWELSPRELEIIKSLGFGQES